MKGGMMYKQGDIVLIPFLYTDLTGMKQRPALIISNESINKTEDRICCLITSNEPLEGILLQKDSFQNNLLPFKSWVKPQRLFTIHERIVKKKLCSVTKKFQKEIFTSIHSSLQIE